MCPTFLSTSPLRGTTQDRHCNQVQQPDFYPRPPCGGRRWKPRRPSPAAYFYPRPPCGGRPATDQEPMTQMSISIHVPLAGDDSFRSTGRPLRHDFYPRPPCGGRPKSSGPMCLASLYFYPRPPCGGRQARFPNRSKKPLFLSTSPLRGTTGCPGQNSLAHFYFYPRPPCGGRPLPAPRPSRPATFLSTSPLRGTTRGLCHAIKQVNYISIHVPLAGDDTG